MGYGQAFRKERGALSDKFRRGWDVELCLSCYFCCPCYFGGPESTNRDRVLVLAPAGIKALVFYACVCLIRSKYAVPSRLTRELEPDIKT